MTIIKPDNTHNKGKNIKIKWIHRDKMIISKGLIDNNNNIILINNTLLIYKKVSH